MDMKIYIVEDDNHLLDALTKSLRNWSYGVSSPSTFENIIEDFLLIKPHLVILDIQLPKYDGFHWCREIRAISNVPIVFLSSRDHPMDMIMAMNIGADDYVQKPFNTDILLAKIQAILRRTYAYEEGIKDVIEWNEALIDMKRGVIRKGGKEVDLTKNEFFILTALVKANNEIISRHELMRMLWEDDQFINDNTLTANMARLRQKLSILGISEAIVTKKGLGYLATTL
ncbi:response regulator transcription factor [Salipaludibacillus agaradhaerens]|jgi:OmpR family two-component system bacitracin resistance response regulator BceR|uniref:response regulator transcription factor n=1 Tax=Salipaludibacillus agaradhaerens TaxID=76935 RepID=UPI002151879E|nr:response regulator transcription factor [Salipaludibacillus agaradhaerens]MCR6106137.1 response regulator transcription factor [Salipaludibacillus agaradhaerens]MCR6118170.1 response regulator transcription factor [Salipaludibacillus agaradhaerens]